MNTKSFLVCFIVVMLATSIAMAGTHHGNFAPARGGFVRNGTGSFHGGNWNGGNWNRGHWNGGNWGGNWHHHDNFNNFVFVGGFGFPFFGYPYGYGYYPYGYGGAGYSGNGYYPSSYSRGYGYNGDRSRVVRLQQQLARAGYYRGPIDGVMGSRTHYALRAYQHDHGTASVARD